MKKMKRLVAVLLAGIMALAMLTACGGTGNDAATAELEAKVEQAYMAKLNDKLYETYGKKFEENNDDIKKLAVEHIEKMANKEEPLSRDDLWAKKDLTAKTHDVVMICYDSKQSNGKEYVKSSYEAANAENITPDEATIKAFLNLVRNKAQAGNKAKFTALGVGVKTINGKTYVAIGLRVEG